MSRRKNDAFNIDDLSELFRKSPVWLGPFVAISVFAGLTWIVHWFVMGHVESGLEDILAFNCTFLSPDFRLGDWGSAG